MAHALDLARRAWGQTHPNPMVGALIVEDGQIVAEGWHAGAGQPHAEVEALSRLGRPPRHDATLYVTLEPCSTQGCTGACTEAILESGLRRVVIGATDPNPAHAGAGLALLRAAGLEVLDGVLADACTDLNLIFNYWITEQAPFLAGKIATTLDGKFAAANGHSQWITGSAARNDVMRWRRYFPAIAVSANTVLADNPRLTSRRGDAVWCGHRFVFDRALITAARATSVQLYSDRFAEQTTVVCSEAAARPLQAILGDCGVKLWQLPETDGHLDLSAFRQRCYRESICGVYLEPGPSWASALIEQRAIDYIFHYLAPKYLCDSEGLGCGSPRQTQSLNHCRSMHKSRLERFEEDVLVRGHL